MWSYAGLAYWICIIISAGLRFRRQACRARCESPHRLLRHGEVDVSRLLLHMAQLAAVLLCWCQLASVVVGGFFVSPDPMASAPSSAVSTPSALQVSVVRPERVFIIIGLVGLVVDQLLLDQTGLPSPVKISNQPQALFRMSLGQERDFSNDQPKSHL